jgi:hypothetical protein
LPDLIDSAPTVEAPPPPADLSADPAPAPPQPEKRAPKDLDARFEEVLVADRAAKASQKAADIALKTATDREAKALELEKKLARYNSIDEHLSKGERAAAIKALLGKIDDDILYDLAPLVETKEMTVEEAVEAALAAKERKALEAATTKAEADAAAAQTTADATVTEYLVRSASYLKANLATFPLIKALGCDHIKYQTLSADWIESKGTAPEPQDILQLIEAEHLSKIKNTPYGPKEEPNLSLEDHAAATFERHRPKGKPVERLDTGRMSGAEEAIQNLERYEQEKRNKLTWR